MDDIVALLGPDVPVRPSSLTPILSQEIQLKIFNWRNEFSSILPSFLSRFCHFVQLR